MRKEIRTERTHLFAPDIGVALKVQIDGNPNDEQIETAIKEAVSMNEILNCKIVVEKDGRAYYEKIEYPQYSFEISDEDWMILIKRNTKRKYHILEGELCRFFLIRHEAVLELLIIGHHLAGDGLSFIYLLKDIMNSLEGKQLQYKALELVDVNKFPKKSNMLWIKRRYLNGLNKKWNATKVVFNRSDYKKIVQEYSNNYLTEIFQRTLNEEETNRLILFSKEIGVTVNSVMMTVFIKAFPEKISAGMAISIRDKMNKGMANYVSGSAISYHYDSSLSFMENVRKVHKRIYHTMNDLRKKYLVLHFIDRMDGSLLDSAFMVKYLGYQNQLSEKMAKFMNYDNPSEIGISNLTRVELKVDNHKYAIKEMVFVPPTVPYSKRSFGIVTFEDRMCITMNSVVESSIKEERILFDHIINLVKEL